MPGCPRCPAVQPGSGCSHRAPSRRPSSSTSSPKLPSTPCWVGTLYTFPESDAKYANSNISTSGVLGDMEDFFAPVEAQKRGSLHLHLLGWLANVPDPSQLKTMIQNLDFRKRLFAFLERNVYQGFLKQALRPMHLSRPRTHPTTSDPAPASPVPQEQSPPRTSRPTSCRNGTRTQLGRTSSVCGCIVATRSRKRPRPTSATAIPPSALDAGRSGTRTTTRPANQGLIRTAGNL
jgi:hypothetical protein